jgi:8-oxo-dGTP pyrophosphatase MutT (NUDIX family)
MSTPVPADPVPASPVSPAGGEVGLTDEHRVLVAGWTGGQDRPMTTIRRLGSRKVYANQWMTLREDDIERPDGSTGIYAVIDKPDFALVIPVERDGFHLVEQYRYPVGGRYWEFPQGTAKDGAEPDPVALARAELAEETGLTAGRVEHLGHLHCAYGMSSQGFNAFRAADLRPGRPDPEPEEQDLRAQWFPRAQFEDMVLHGTITDDSTLAAYTLLVLHERRAAGAGP